MVADAESHTAVGEPLVEAEEGKQIKTKENKAWQSLDTQYTYTVFVTISG